MAANGARLVKDETREASQGGIPFCCRYLTIRFIQKIYVLKNYIFYYELFYH
jgi:hypothetical protein